MGTIKTSQQKNGSFLLEISYGGADSPFGGIDTSAPPAYIDPKSFVDSDGFLIVDNKIVACSLQATSIPTLWNGVIGISLISAGTFFNNQSKAVSPQWNYALGVSYDSEEIRLPHNTTYTFYMTVWNPSNIADVFTDIVSYTLFDGEYAPTQASILLPVGTPGVTAATSGTSAVANILTLTNTYPPPVSLSNQIATYTISGGTGYTVGEEVLIEQNYNNQGSGSGLATATVNTVGGSGNILTSTLTNPGFNFTVGPASVVGLSSTTVSLIVTGPNGGPNTYSLTLSATLNSAADLVAQMSTAINSAPDPNVVATSSPDGSSLILTAIPTGAAGNAVTVQFTYATTPSTLPPLFYFPVPNATNLTGGTGTTVVTGGFDFGEASVVNVGGTLYIGNIGPVILKYSGLAQFLISTMYSGANVLSRFAGSLVGLGNIPQIGTIVQSADMVFSWSATNDLDTWNPINAQGFVTGAGFAQLADIGDALTGLIISNNTGWIIRQQGLTYVTPTGNGTSPYNFANVSLGARGDGGQVPSLICQYDQMGAYIGNTNVWSITQSPSPIGEKIKNSIFAYLAALPDPIPFEPLEMAQYAMSSNACAIQIGGTEGVFFAFLLGQTIYFTSATNSTWSKMTYTLPTAPLYFQNGFMSTLSNSGLATPGTAFSQSSMALAAGVYNSTGGGLVQPQIYSLLDGIAPSNAPGISNPTPYILFPVEEISFGRNITLDGLYMSLFAYIPEGSLTLTFTIYGQVLVGGVSQTQTIQEITLTITAAEFGSPITIITVPTEFQLFSSVGSFTVNSPQLKVSAVSNSTSTCSLYFSKISMFGSFDPNQRPV